MIRYISSPEQIITLSCRTLDEALQEILYALLPTTLPSRRWGIYTAMCQKEDVLPNGAAFPRAETPHVRKIMCAVGFPESDAFEGSASGTRIETLFVTLYPQGWFEKVAPVLANLMRFSQNPEKMTTLKRDAGQEEKFEVIRDEVFPLGARGFIHSHLLSPILRMHQRT